MLMPWVVTNAVLPPSWTGHNAIAASSSRPPSASPVIAPHRRSVGFFMVGR